MSALPDDNIGTMLLDAGLITESQLKAALEMKKVMNKLPLGQIFVRFGGPTQPFPKIDDHEVELLIARQKHGRANGRPLAEAGAAVHSLKAARAALDANKRTLAEGAESSRRISVNEDLGETIDAAQHIGDE